MNNINQLADDFVANDHFNADAIDNKRKSVAERFAALQEPLKAREEKLNDALKLQQYFRYSYMKIWMDRDITITDKKFMKFVVNRLLALVKVHKRGKNGKKSDIW